MNETEIKAALLKVCETYGKLFAARLEQLYRNETRHFTSGNFLKTLSPGMQATSKSLPYGWKSLEQFWIANPHFAPTGIFEQVENTSKLATSIGKQKFMVFPSVYASMMSLSKLFSLRNNNFGTWFSTDPIKIEAYNKELDAIIPRIVRTFN